MHLCPRSAAPIGGTEEYDNAESLWFDVYGVLVCHFYLRAVPAEFPVLSDSEIRKILVERIDAFHMGVGIVVGVIDPQGRRVVAYGSLNQGDSRPLNGDTIFEIGSVTKVFTSLLLSDMVQHGEVALADPVAKYLPADVKVPERGGRVITLVDLSTHTSGLPRLPSNLLPKDPANPYADYTVEQLYQFLSSYQLTRDIGAQFEYSNLGGGLLGHALARRAGMDYEALVRSRISSPLGMSSTGITLTPEMKGRLAVGHNDKLTAVPNWDLPTLAGAGALRSSANDLLTFLGANLGYVKSPLAPAMAAMLSVRRPPALPDLARSVSPGSSLSILTMKSSGTTVVPAATGPSSAMTQNPRWESSCCRIRKRLPALTTLGCICSTRTRPCCRRRRSIRKSRSIPRSQRIRGSLSTGAELHPHGYPRRRPTFYAGHRPT